MTPVEVKVAIQIITLVRVRKYLVKNLLKYWVTAEELLIYCFNNQSMTVIK